ncbi:MAG: ABC transporter permease [Elusimicrobiaceae bacterium]|nr:ABC transporter permease [Elusimicrobiaceae bacterium]
MSFELFIAERYLKAKRKGLFAVITTLIAVAGVAVGVAAMITTLSVMNGFQQDIQSKIIGAQAHIVIFGEMDAAARTAITSRLLHDREVRGVSPMVLGQAILSFNRRSSGIVLRGLDPDQEINVSNLMASITGGGWEPRRRLNEKDVPPAIILGEELARNMAVWIGDDVVLISPQSMDTGFGILPKMKKFRISGVLKTGYYEFDNTMAYARVTEAADFLGMGDKITGLEVKLDDVDRAGEVARRIKRGVGFPYMVKTFSDMNSTLYAALKLEKFVMFLILGLIVLVAALNISSNLILLGTEKMRDIGILRAIGATPRKIQNVFWWEGFLIGTTGIALGLALGLTLCWIISTFNIVELPSDVYYITRVPVSIRPADVLLVVLGSYLLCFVAILYPAIRTSRVNPVDAIRYG